MIKQGAAQAASFAYIKNAMHSMSIAFAGMIMLIVGVIVASGLLLAAQLRKKTDIN